MDKEEIEGLFIGEITFSNSIFEQDILEFRERLQGAGYKTVYTDINTYEIYKPE